MYETLLRLPFTSHPAQNIPQYAPTFISLIDYLYLSDILFGYNDPPLLLVDNSSFAFILYTVWPFVCAFIRYHDPLDGTYLTIYIYLL